MNLPQIHIGHVLYAAAIVMLICFIIFQMDENRIKANLIANLTANLTKLTTVQSFIDDYNEYSSICNRFQNDKANILKQQCTAQNFTFQSYYVSYPSNDFLITCITPDGKAQVMRFR